jgi:hypothetical protein
MAEKKSDTLIEEVDHEHTAWADMPQAAKMTVYETMRECMARYRKESAELCFNRDNRPQAVARLLLASAFEAALWELEELDEDLCGECGGYHPPEDHAHPAPDRKDLS